MNDNQIKTEIDVEISAEVAEGCYSNLTIVSHSTSEFVMDFVRMMPGLEKSKVHSRIIMTPEHTKRLMLTLQENVSRYESMLGEIELRAPEDPVIKGFGGGLES